MIGYASFSFMWSAVEVNSLVICGCVPTLKPLIAGILPILIRDTDEASHIQNAPYGTSSISTTLERPIVDRGYTPPHPVHNPIFGIPRRPNFQLFTNISSLLDRSRSEALDAGAVTAHNSISHPPERTFVDFVDIRNPKSMLKLNNKESILPNALITLIFFMWGFAYGFLGALNTQFQLIVQLNVWQSLGLHGAYFGGYAIGPLLIGRTVLKCWGFKSTFITGLCIYGVGALIFWPSAVLISFVGFIISNVVVGCGLGVLETAANPFLSLCGPLENAEIRLNLSQGVQAIGSVLSQLLAQRLLFKRVKDVASLVDVQWTYLGIALFDALLAAAFFYLPIPEASDEDLQELADQRREENKTKVAGVPVVWLTAGLGVWSQFFYVAGQEVFSTSFVPFVVAAHPESPLTSLSLVTLGHAVFAAGRFLTAFSQLILKPRWTLLISYIGMIVFAVLCMKTTGVTAVAMAMMIYLFESGAFSTIFAISLRGTGRHTKTIASFLAAAICGGSFFPFAQQSLSLARGESFSFVVLAALFSAGALYPLYLNLVLAAKKQVDPVPNEHIRCRRRRNQSACD
jgi:fucose permease